MFGLGPWWYNFSQFHRGELTVDNLTSVPSPFIELTLFGGFKAAEILSFIGGCVVAPMYRLHLLKNLSPEKTTNNSTKIIRNTCRKVQGRFLLASFVAGPLSTLVYVYYKGLDKKQAKELCYQIRCNEKMMVWDRAAVSLGFVGWYWKRFQGAVDGINIASLYVVYYFTVHKWWTDTSTTDKIKPWQRPESLEQAEETRRTLPFLSKKALPDDE